ncbi:MAG: L-seryl-tRNA(Sec) selenium transferase [Hyphomicrobiales bacterium]|nr:L-seryl-tRNA(Sec) selenium transferase [Hyphomicrobiales bacterium]
MDAHRPQIPSVDEILRTETAIAGIASHGRQAVVSSIRATLDSYRRGVLDKGLVTRPRTEAAMRIAAAALDALSVASAPRLRRVFNLTGTVLHTNLGRAVVAEVAIEAAIQAMRYPAALEFDVATGGRGERDDAVRSLLCELTGAEDAIAVNNNAAAVMLALATLASGRDTIVSRGELIEIGGAFRIPDIMARAGTRLVEVGTTNRTHFKDYVEAIGPDTALLMKVHTSNYLIQGFTAEVPAVRLAPLAREKGIPLVDDLGSGTLVDLGRWGLKRERTVMDAVRDGADLVTFSGDKLLGGVQAGFIVGRRDLVQKCARNPMKRAMRLDKVRLAALEATLKLYRDPDRLAETLPTLRLLARGHSELQDVAARLAPSLQNAGDKLGFVIDTVSCASQIGSGALPLETIPSVAIRLAPSASRRDAGRKVEALAAAFRALPIPVIGRIEKGSLLLDLRCLDDEAAFIAQLAKLGDKGLGTEE